MFSKYIRRIHMYLGLMMIPWIVVYASAAALMNHREFFMDYYDGDLWRSDVESERPYPVVFPEDAGPEQMASEILDDLDLQGAHNVSMNSGNRTLTINRDDPFAPREIRYHMDEGKLVVRRFPLRVPTFLTRLHHRHGFGRHAASIAWGIAAELAAVAMIFWVGSGLWMWWQLKAIRGWGLVCLGVGSAMLAFFLTVF